jgi:HPt (histidine-containing phosphotransfer) domain-containing protein
MDDEELAGEIAEGFLVDAAKQIGTLNTLRQNPDLDLIRRQVHSLKGASANISALALQKTAERIEDAAVNGDLQTALELIPDLDNLLQMLGEAMSRSGILKK